MHLGIFLGQLSKLGVVDLSLASSGGNIDYHNHFPLVLLKADLSTIKWNFSKFIIDKDGRPVSRLSPMTDPIPGVENEIQKLI